DVLGLGGFARDIGDYVALIGHRAVGHADVRADRQIVPRILHPAFDLRGLAADVLDRNSRANVDVLELDDDVGARAGALVDPLLHRLAFEDVAVFYLSADFGDDRRGVGVPFRNQLARLDGFAVGLAQLGAVDQRIVLALALTADTVLSDHRLDDYRLAMARHHDQQAVLAADGVDVVQAEHAIVARLQRGLLGAPTGSAADMEGAHRELRAGLADRLRGDGPDRLAQVDQMAAAEVASVALDAHPLARLAGQHRADLDALGAGVLDRLDLIFVDHFVGADQDFVGERVAHVFERDAAEYAVAEPLDNLAAFDQRSHLDAVDRAAIQLGDDRILRHVDQAAGQITRIRGLERGIGQTLAGAVSRDEVLQHRQPFAEVGGDRGLDYFARRLRHQAAQPGELADLLLRAARA